jgi:hypothetical protein
MNKGKTRRQFIRSYGMAATGLLLAGKQVARGNGINFDNHSLRAGIFFSGGQDVSLIDRIKMNRRIEIIFESGISNEREQHGIITMERHTKELDAIIISPSDNFDDREFNLAIHALRSRKHVYFRTVPSFDIPQLRHLAVATEQSGAVCHFEPSKRESQGVIIEDSNKIYCFSGSIDFLDDISASGGAGILLNGLLPLKSALLFKIECCSAPASHIIFHLRNGEEDFELHWIENNNLLHQDIFENVVKRRLNTDRSLYTWVNECSGRTVVADDSFSSFDPASAALLCEMIYAGNMAIKATRHLQTGLNYKFIYPSHYMSFLWDSQQLTVINYPDANQFLAYP